MYTKSEFLKVLKSILDTFEKILLDFILDIDTYKIARSI